MVAIDIEKIFSSALVLDETDPIWRVSKQTALLSITSTAIFGFVELLTILGEENVFSFIYIKQTLEITYPLNSYYIITLFFTLYQVPASTSVINKINFILMLSILFCCFYFFRFKIKFTLNSFLTFNNFM